MKEGSPVANMEEDATNVNQEQNVEHGTYHSENGIYLFTITPNYAVQEPPFTLYAL